VKYGQSIQEGKESAQNSLFGDSAEEIEAPKPPIPEGEHWHSLVSLEKEKEVVGIYLSGHPLDDFKKEMTNFRFIECAQLNDLNKYSGGNDLRSGGIITAAEHRINKNGKPFGSFTIEDYSGSFQARVFSETYLKIKHFLEKGSILYFNWKTKTSYRNPEELELDILSMGLLSDLKDRYTQITLTISEPHVNTFFVDQLTSIIKQNPGKCKVKIRIQSPDPTLSIQLISSSFKVDANPDFVRELEKLVGNNYLLN
jgi:DNA polymerase-3 subunit alpha